MLLWFLKNLLLIHRGQKISVHGSQSENIPGKLHIVYIKIHISYSTYAVPKRSICAQALSYSCWGDYKFLIYLLLYLSEFYYAEDFCILHLIFFNIGHFIYHTEYLCKLLKKICCCLVAQSCLTLCLFVTPWTSAPQACLAITNSWSLFKLMSIKLMMSSNHLILCCPLLLPPSIFPSIRVFYNESVLHIRGPKYWSFSFSVSLSNEYSGLIFFRMDWSDLLAVQGTLKESSPPQLKSISSLVLSFLYGPTLTSIHDYWKNHSFD